MDESEKTDIHTLKILGEGAFGIVDLVVSGRGMLVRFS